MEIEKDFRSFGDRQRKRGGKEHEMKKMEQAKATSFEVITYTDCDEDNDTGRTISSHKFYHRAAESVKKAQYENIDACVYAMIDGTPKAVIEVKGKIPANMTALDERYVDDSGDQFVKCVDGHFETIQTINDAGWLTSYYTTACISK